MRYIGIDVHTNQRDARIRPGVGQCIERWICTKRSWRTAALLRRRSAPGAVGAIVIALLVCAPMFYDLGRWPLMDPDEGRNAEVAREMLTLGPWAVPRFNNLPFLDKPPLLFWSIAGAYRMLGTSELSARLPSALAGLAVVLLAMAMTRMLLDRRSALWAAVIVGTAPLVLVYARLTIFDMPFTALVTLALVCLLRARIHGRPMVWLPLAGLAMGLAALTKGPVGVAVPLLAWGAARGALPPPRDPSRKRAVLAALLVFLAVVTPWCLMVARAEPDFLRYAMVDETVLRFTSAARFRRGEPFYYPMLISAIGLGVWTAVLLGTASILGRCTDATARQRIAIRFAAHAATAIILFFSISASKRAGYVLPAMVPLAVLVAAGITMAAQRAAAAVRVAALGALAAALVFVVVAWDPAALTALKFGSASDAVTQPVLVVVTTVLFAWGGLVVGAGRVWPMAPLALAAVVAPTLYLAIQRPLVPYVESRSARSIASFLPTGATVVSFRHFRPSLPFYLRHPVSLATTDGHELTSNYVSSQHRRFFTDDGLMSPADARRTILEASMIYVLTAASWDSTLPRFRSTPLTLVARDRRSALWVTSD